MSTTLPTSDGFAPSQKIFPSEKAFKISLWVCTGLCIIVAALRFTIRLVSFRRLLTEDYLMLFSLLALIAISAVLQHFLGDIYTMIAVENQLIIPGPDFLDEMLSGLRADGIAIILNTLGIWAIKLNFLSFFRGFGRQIKTYQVFWWISSTLVVACGFAQLGVIPYRCVFGSLYQITTECATESNIGHIYTAYKASVAVDVISDAIIICFPVFITWRTKLNLPQKLLLTGVFLLVGLTIAVTIVRGSIFGGVYKALKDIDHKVINTEWILFWFFIQYIVSFIIACIISFRSLWIIRERKSRDKKIEDNKKHGNLRAHGKPSPVGQDIESRWKKVHDTLMQSLWELEGADVVWNGSSPFGHESPSGTLAVEFSQWSSTLGDGLSTDAAASTQHLQKHSQAKVTSSV